MSMPKIPDMCPEISITRDDAVNIIIASIAMEELALAHILNAEGEKLQYVLGTLNDNNPDDVTICDIMAVNNSIQKTLRDVIKAEMLLQLKLEDAIELDENEDCCYLTIKGRKTWRDGNNVHGTRPATVVISLLRDGVEYKTATIDTKGNGVYTFTCLPIWKDSETKYIYTVDELDVPTGYRKTVDGFNIINTAQPGSRSVDGTKIWVDDYGPGDTRPDEITINLFQNSVKHDTLTVPIPDGGGDTNPFSFTNVPRFDNEGNPFVYTMDEVDVDGYEKSIDGYNITNTLKKP